jgi:hypothetical protein
MMSELTEEIEGAASELIHAMARFVRALDAVEDDSKAATHIPERLSAALDGLATRVSAAITFKED